MTYFVPSEELYLLIEATQPQERQFLPENIMEKYVDPNVAKADYTTRPKPKSEPKPKPEPKPK